MKLGGKLQLQLRLVRPTPRATNLNLDFEKDFDKQIISPSNRERARFFEQMFRSTTMSIDRRYHAFRYSRVNVAPRRRATGENSWEG